MPQHTRRSQPLPNTAKKKHHISLLSDLSGLLTASPLITVEGYHSARNDYWRSCPIGTVKPHTVVGGGTCFHLDAGCVNKTRVWTRLKFVYDREDVCDVLHKVTLQTLQQTEVFIDVSSRRNHYKKNHTHTHTNESQTVLAQ